MKFDKLTYVFQSGRKKRLSSNDKFPFDFFYGFNFLENRFNETEIIEFENRLKKINISKLCSTILRKISGLPFYFEKVSSRKNFKNFKNSDLIVLTNQRVAFSCIPILLIIKIFYKPKSIVFIMGVFDVTFKSKTKNYFRKLFLKYFLLFYDNFIFLSEGEYNFVLSKYPKLSYKLKFNPFSIDSKFWTQPSKDLDFNNNILFIGNDGNRDYDFLIDLAKELSEFNFQIISKKLKLSDFKSSNIKLHNGKWDSSEISDVDLINFYHKAFLTVIPLKESLQPSGQSVALQSMSCGTPVIITSTLGFWEPEKFKNFENIIFVKNNDINFWKNAVFQLRDNKNIYDEISKNGIKTVKDFYDLNQLNIFLNNLISNY